MATNIWPPFFFTHKYLFVTIQNIVCKSVHIVHLTTTKNKTLKQGQKYQSYIRSSEKTTTKTLKLTQKYLSNAH